MMAYCGLTSKAFHWLKDKGVTAVITGEKGDGHMTRYGLEEYVSDCVILLDSRVENQISTRRMRIVKYRGSAHGSNEYPFLIDENGFTVLLLHLWDWITQYPWSGSQAAFPVSITCWEEKDTSAEAASLSQYRRYRKNNPGCSSCKCSLQKRGKMPLFCFRRVQEPDNPQYAFYRYRS